MCDKKIVICLPRCMRLPSGGFKIAYTLANMLVNDGFEVVVAYDTYNNLGEKTPRFIKYIYGKIITKFRPKWYKLDKKIIKISALQLDEKYLPDSDYIVATSVETALLINALPKRKGEKIYLIQDFENWNVSTEELIKTYEYEMKKIVISTWLYELVKQYTSHKIFLMPNAISLDKFYITTPIEERNNESITFLYATREMKGVKYTLAVLDKIKKMHPYLNVSAFGVEKRPKDLPDWINYHENVNQDELRGIYNSSAIFICSSIDEGYGLTGAESMACGCCLVTSEYRGVLEYAVDRETAMMSPVCDVDKMVENVEYLLSHNDYRKKLAQAGNMSIQEKNWDKSYSIFKNIITKKE